MLLFRKDALRGRRELAIAMEVPVFAFASIFDVRAYTLYNSTNGTESLSSGTSSEWFGNVLSKVILLRGRPEPAANRSIAQEETFDL